MFIITVCKLHFMCEHLCRYWCSWRTESTTRYLVYIDTSGTYLVSQGMHVTRAQMRFPLWRGRDLMDIWQGRFDSGQMERPKEEDCNISLATHRGTLVDGEMVVNTLPDGTQQRVLYLTDLMVFNGFNAVGLPWQVRTQRSAHTQKGIAALHDSSWDRGRCVKVNSASTCRRCCRALCVL